MAKHIYTHRPPQRRHIQLRWVALALAVIALIVWPFVEASQLTIDEHTLYIRDLPANLRNLRIVYASDIHQCAWFPQSRVNELIKTLNSLSADIVILGGDYAVDSAGAIAFFQSAPALQARLGVFGVVGNHDRTVPESNLSKLMATMKNYGCLPLVNNVASVKVGKTYVYIAGVDDVSNGSPDVAGVASQVRSDDFVIFAGHSPNLIPDMLKARAADGDNHWFDIALFGHTHGGQINLFGYTPFNNLTPELGSRYLSGWLEENRAAVLISNGVGTSFAPMRMFATPQVHLITLKSR